MSKRRREAPRSGQRGLLDRSPVYGVQVVEHPSPPPPTVLEALPAPGPLPPPAARPHPKLGQLAATALCGNDITSSCLYTAAIATAFAGFLAPLALAMVAACLYLYRKVYAEVGSALPLNGGAYNALLNSTTKFRASIAACMTILSYLATAVISGKTAMEYLHQILPSLPVLPATVGLLGLFAVLAIIGISESAGVALVIFVLHLTTLVLFCVLGAIHLAADPSVFVQNWGVLPKGTTVQAALFFGFAAGLLGISGFESSANFIEEQKPGVFPKTLRNMWLAVSVFNPLIGVLVLGLMPITRIDQARDFLLADASQVIGSPLKLAVSIDAVLVLSGAVLTAFVGVGGLVRRMTLDRCLPQVLLRTNRRGTNHWIFVLFFLLCASILVITRGNLLALAGVYTISFLGVMALFAVGNILLKVKRGRLRRDVKASWLTVILAFCAALAGMIGNALLDPTNLLYFATYFVPTVAVVGIMFLRLHLLRLGLLLIEGMALRVSKFNSLFRAWLLAKMEEINGLSVVFFTRGDDVANLNRAMLYIMANETTKRVRVLHLYQDRDAVPERLQRDLETLDEIYPEISIELILRRGTFTPETVEQISREYGVPKNYMFIGAPGSGFPHALSEYGGVRLII